MSTVSRLPRYAQYTEVCPTRFERISKVQVSSLTTLDGFDLNRVEMGRVTDRLPAKREITCRQEVRQDRAVKPFSDFDETNAALGLALASARNCGVTRLADITRLDRIGVRVFQAVRPMGRALSVHQGKGLSTEAAKIGALMEAIESDHAEKFEGEQRLCAHDSLAPNERPTTLGDFANDLAASPANSEPLAWVRAERLMDARPYWAPFDFVSLDFTRRGDARLERSSNGLGAGFDREAATVTALLEVIERDAVHVWRATSRVKRSSDRIDIETIPFAWFQDIHERVRTAGLRLAIYRAPAVIALPVFIAELVEPTADGPLRRRLVGSACRHSPEQALLRSVVEAAQARLTAISGVRDDILPSEPEQHAGLGLGLPLSRQMRPRAWDEVAARHADISRADPHMLAYLLAGAGYDEVAVIDLTRTGGAVFVVKALVPGLAAGGRSRRNTAAAA